MNTSQTKTMSISKLLRFALIAAVLAVPGYIARLEAAQGPTTTLSLPKATLAPGAEANLPLTLVLAQGQVYSADLVITYDPAVIQALSVAKGALVPNWSLATNITTPGTVRGALAGTQPVTDGGELLVITIRATGPDPSSTPLIFAEGALNEGAMPTNLHRGSIVVGTPATCFDLVNPSPGVGSEDVQAVGTRWHLTAADPDPDNIVTTPNYTAHFDVDRDGDVDIVDIMRVAAAWNNICN